MKILATADWHVDADSMKRAQYPPKNRQQDRLAAIDQLCIFAREYKPDLILHGGDWFHHNRPASHWARETASRVRELSLVAPIVTVPGNHDLTAQGSTVDAWAALAPKNLHICTSPRVTPLPMANILAIPWLTTRHLAEYGKSKIREAQELLAAIEMLLEFWKMQLPDDKPKVLVAHASALADMGGHRPSVLGHDPIWKPDFFYGFDFVCLGHFHKAQIIQEDVVYPGSPERVTFTEHDEDKGFYTWEDGKIEFHALETRPMIQLEGTADEIAAQLHTVPDEALLKIKVHCESSREFSVAGNRWAALQIEKIMPRQEREIRLAQGITAENPLQLLEFYFREVKKFDEGKVTSLMEKTKELMKEVFEDA